jgi:hypothetical protein
MKKDAMYRICAGGLKARQSLAQGNALCQGRPVHTPSPEGVESVCPDYALSGLGIYAHSFRRALPCANDYRAFSPNAMVRIRYTLFISHS